MNKPISPSLNSAISNGTTLLFFLITSLFLTGCGSLTGIPGHGGGKRFAVEQELIAATSRATIKQLDLSSIQGKKVNIFINAIGDTGVGNLLGGRFSLVSQLRGNYIQTAPVTENSTYQPYISTTKSSSRSSTSSDGKRSSSSTSSTSSTDKLIETPSSTESEQEGFGSDLQFGIEYNGLGAYQNSDRISANDLQYLYGLLQTYFFLQDVIIVPPSEAEVDVYVIIDVFGTIRTRTDWLLANNEILQAKTSLEVLAIDHQSGKLIMAPQSVYSSAEYNEQYIFWTGPVMIKKFLKNTDPLLSDFTDLSVEKVAKKHPEQDGAIPYPFRHQIRGWLENK